MYRSDLLFSRVSFELFLILDVSLEDGRLMTALVLFSEHMVLKKDIID